MLSPLTNVLVKVFANTFYKAHAGIFLFLLLTLLGLGYFGSVINFHKSLMLYFMAKPFIMVIAFGVVLLYTLKCCHFISAKIREVHQQFLFYSVNSYTKREQISTWIIVQAVVSIPMLVYMLISLVLAISHQYYFSAFITLVYLATLLLLSALFYTWQINKLIDGHKSILISRLIRPLRKPFFTLYFYHVFHSHKIRYSVIKLLSYLTITAVFLLFADVKTDIRVASIAMLAVATAHCMLVLEARKFEITFLAFVRTLPISRFKLFISQIGSYGLLLLPEFIWLLFNLPALIALGLFAFCLSIILLLCCSLYLFGLDQEKYFKVVFGTFIITFILILFNLMCISVFINLSAAYLIFYLNYYKFKETTTSL
ncbi:hypothetical protein [Pedobacter sp. V48]|uniref:hypothetical protein n=1 Tax=Pedobacter sp. V48 TaxID=509635 RepID=UPI0003E587C3|nr:hypothetical protein [Pedobacter sp. V48]ETZ22584.1 hypothetical protein N824_22170 [Pedobacter sp. V48]